jgi:anthranilate synthase component 1
MHTRYSMLIPSRDEFLRASGGNRPMAVAREVLADVETPVSAYWKLAHDQIHSFLLESVSGGENVSRYSYIGVRPRAVLRSKGRMIRRIDSAGEETKQIPEGKDPLDYLQFEMLPQAPIRTAGLPDFTGGAVGMFAYDIVRFFEKLPDSTTDDLQLDDMAMMLTDTIVAFDHAKNLMQVIAMTDGSEQSYEDAESQIEWVFERLSKPLPALPSGTFPVSEPESNFTQERFEEAVRKVQGYITQGDGIQMVPSQRLSMPVQAHPLTVYRSLRTINPSPYMFLVQFPDFQLVGASPELLVSLHGRRARVRPIAGTRWRGKSEEEDQKLAEELLADEKERAEHIMLVDLGRNDLGRVCEYGSVRVNDLMVIERYSHVMHIVSDVTGTLAPGKTAFDLFRAAHPAGTVSGAPKVRAMQIIDEIEPTRRGSYAGSVGAWSYSGGLDTCIAIRTILMKEGKAYVQAGGGVVYDSVPAKEFEETLNKARASLRAIEKAQRGL